MKDKTARLHGALTHLEQASIILVEEKIPDDLQWLIVKAIEETQQLISDSAQGEFPIVY